MKKWALLLALFVPACIAAQEAVDYLSQIPVRDNKVVFSKNYTLPENTGKQAVHDSLSSVLVEFLKNKRGIIRVNDTVNHRIVIQVFHYMEVEKKPLSIFAMWAKYALVFDYGSDSCTAEIRNIILIEPDSESATRRLLHPKAELPDRLNDGAFSAEDVFLKKRYKVAFVPNAANKIAGCLIADVNRMDALLQQKLR